MTSLYICVILANLARYMEHFMTTGRVTSIPMQSLKLLLSETENRMLNRLLVVSQ